MFSRYEIAQCLPDVPRWVEARACLLDGPCELHRLRFALGWIKNNSCKL